MLAHVYTMHTSFCSAWHQFQAWLQAISTSWYMSRVFCLHLIMSLLCGTGGQLMHVHPCCSQVCWQIPHLHSTVLTARHYERRFNPGQKHMQRWKVIPQFPPFFWTCLCRWMRWETRGWLQECYLEQVMEPTALVWLEPRATQCTWPLSPSICHMRTDLS